MKKQFHKIKIAAENFSQRSSKPEKNDELQHVERQVDKYRDVLQTLSKKVSPSNSISGQDVVAREKRMKKTHEYLLGQAMEDLEKDLPEGLLRKILDYCGKLEKTIASEIVKNEMNIESDVSKKLNSIIESHITTVQKQKRVVAKCHQDNEAAKQKLQSASRLSENAAKMNQLKDDQEECETRLEKERDIYASNMFDLLAEEDNISNYILNYVKYQQLFYKSALEEIENLMSDMNAMIRVSNKRVFNTSLEDHLDTSGRKISYVIELCVCCLLEKGLYEEGLLRVGCGKSKLMRMKSAIDANFVTPPIPLEYQDVHVVASVLKAYLRSLPEPLLTYRLYNDFMEVSQIVNDQQRKAAILNIINQLPEGNYNNLKYLMKFLSKLSEKNQQNKMSTQNIAIVMSPNLLWPQNENDQNYAQQVTSTSAVNTVVETLIGDWDFFFEGDVNFYETMSRDELFPDNGGFPYDKEQAVTHHTKAADQVMMSMSMIVGGENVKNGPGHGHGHIQSKLSHSRSSSHDTSLILINDPPMKSSRSNSSLSDTSPTTGSPKLPTRRKPKAPVPPALTTPPSAKPKLETKISLPMSVSKLHDTSSFSYIDSDPSLHVEEGSLKKAGSSDNILAKPDRPPRPVLANAECQTMSKAFVRQVPLKDKSSSASGSSRPVAAPRTTLIRGEFEKSEENLVNLREKPAIPDRPATLVRPASFRAATGGMSSPTSILTNDRLVEELSATFANKAATTVRRNNSLRDGRSSESNGETPQSKQVTTMYSVDKQQVSIVDLPPTGSPHTSRRQLFINESDNKENSQNLNVKSELSGSTDALTDDQSQQQPSSPREGKIKRPQVPPPARPRSSDSSGDTTKL
ncbi:CLUMA_CG015861, isoform A [Clunio marinus]|uniref:CLUMA_CG015861, isoform A n=1 Tax=Clunio marinus TaxID=568069 RepID=A0A1J1IRA1_9DIPT|nr:CLUMA_CG015861, isoform A [Clunio marinus]